MIWFRSGVWKPNLLNAALILYDSTLDGSKSRFWFNVQCCCFSRGNHFGIIFNNSVSNSRKNSEIFFKWHEERFLSYKILEATNVKVLISTQVKHVSDNLTFLKITLGFPRAADDVKHSSQWLKPIKHVSTRNRRKKNSALKGKAQIFS